MQTRKSRELAPKIAKIVAMIEMIRHPRYQQRAIVKSVELVSGRMNNFFPWPCLFLIKPFCSQSYQKWLWFANWCNTTA